MEHVQRKMTQMVKEYETKFYEKQLEEVRKFSLKKRLTRQKYRDHRFQILEVTLHRLEIDHALCTEASQSKDHCWVGVGRTSRRA